MPIVAGQQALASDILTGLAFNELAGGENHDVTSANTWEDWDLSAIVPAGTKVVLLASMVTAHDEGRGARKNGSALNRLFNPVVRLSWLIIQTEVDANRVIEIHSVTMTDCNFNVIGYREWS